MSPTNKPRQIAVIAAHPDDEVLGCGGTIARHATAGDEVSIVILADGESSRDEDRHTERIAAREQAARDAADILGAVRVVFHRLPDNRLDASPRLELAKLVGHHIHDLCPDVVYTHHAGDLNIDHRCVHEAVVTACRPQPGHSVSRLLFFETNSSTEWQPPHSNAPFLPAHFVDVSNTLELKLKALRAYDSEMRDWPHPRSYAAVEHLARWRGATVGCAAAEAFVVGRHIWREAAG